MANVTLGNAIKWSFLAEATAKAIQPIVFIVLARLLAPEDFGVMAAALMVIGFCQILWEAGLGKAIVQRQTDVDEAANVAFWMNLALAGVVVGCLFLAASIIAVSFFQDARVADVIRVMTLHVILSAVSAVPIALLQKRMGFQRLFWVRFATVSLPALASIPMALMGAGYWALVIGALIGQATQAFVLWRQITWRPRLSYNADVAADVVKFGSWVALSGLLTWFFAWGDSLVVGMYLGSHDLGLYRTGNQMAMMLFALLFSPLLPVFYSHLSMMDGDLIRIRKFLTNAISALSFLAIPVALVIFSLAEPTGQLLFGAKWQGIGFVIGVMALMHGYSWIAGVNGEVYRAMGKPSYETVVTASMLVIYLVAYIVSIQHGFEAFVWTRFGLALVALLLHLFVIRKLLAIPAWPVVRNLLLITIVVGSIVLAVQYIVLMKMPSEVMQIVVGIFANLFLLGGGLLLFAKAEFVIELKILLGFDVKQ